jgi:general secretion pathway protein D
MRKLRRGRYLALLVLVGAILELCAVGPALARRKRPHHHHHHHHRHARAAATTATPTTPTLTASAGTTGATGSAAPAKSGATTPTTGTPPLMAQNKPGQPIGPLPPTGTPPLMAQNKPGQPIGPLPPTRPGALSPRPPVGAPGRPGVVPPAGPGPTPPPPPTGTASSRTGANVGEEVPGEMAFNQCRKLPANRKIKVTLKPESELNDLIGWISTMTCRKFIVPQSIRSQKVTIISPVPVTPGEGYRLFLSALNSVGLTVAPAGDALQVVETPRIKEAAPVYTPDESAPGDDRYITRLIRLQNTPAAEIGAVLQKLRSKDGDVSWYDPTGTLIITDTASNVRRMIEVVQALDVAGGSEKIWIVKLHNTTAADMAGKLGEVFQVATGRGGAGLPPGGAPGGRRTPGSTPTVTGQIGETPGEILISKIIPDERTNSLIIVATDHAYARIYALIKRLDTNREEAEAMGEGRVHVYPLDNANADELAATLGALTGAAVTSTGGAGRRTTSRTGGATPPPAPPPPAAGGLGGGTAGTSNLFEGDVRISADKPTNSLVIVSSAKDFLTLKSVIRRLDIPRRQVFIEATILEVSLDRSQSLGINFHGGDVVGSGNEQTLIFGGSGAAKTLVPTNLLGDLAQGLAVGALGPEIQGADQILNQPGISIPAFGVFLKALATSNDVNVLSAPHILTTDNEEAEIKVGQNVPFQGAFVGGLGGLPTGGGGGTTGGATSLPGFLPSVSVQRQDVALDLKITPHVNSSGMVRLEVDQEISDIASENFNGLGPVTSKRTVKTVVVVKDQQPVVLGGLLSDRMSDIVTKVPLLGDIPILGYFFKQVEKKVAKTNLLVFLTPYVISDQSDLKRIFERKLRERREFLERFTSFKEGREFEAHIDYRSKRGLLEEINRTAREADEEQALMERIRQLQSQEEEGPVELPPGFRPARSMPATPSQPEGVPPGGFQPPQPPQPGFVQPPNPNVQKPFVPGTPPGMEKSRINPPRPDR